MSSIYADMVLEGIDLSEPAGPREDSRESAWRALALARGSLLDCYRFGRRPGRAIHACDHAERRLRALGVRL